MHSTRLYENIQLQKIAIDDVSIGLRQIGSGEPLVFIHGFPTHGYTWRKLIPELSKKFTCIILDLPGLGDSGWSKKTNFKSSSLANYIIKLLQRLKISSYSIIAHNSGATIARVIALNQSKQVKNLIMFNTEIPNHRPPWIPFYQRIGLLPFVPNLIRLLLKQNWFIKSPMGFKEFYSNKSMLDHESNILPYTKTVVDSKERAIGALKYVKGIDWKLVDEFKRLHQKIEANVLFIWGADDKTFPLKLGKQMIEQFKSDVQFITIKDASLLPHEEKPDEIVQAMMSFL